MTERQFGAFTISTRLLLSTEHRTRLERLVRTRQADLADMVSEIIADTDLDWLDAQAVRGEAVIPVRVFLTAEQRTRFEELAHQRDTDLAVIVSGLVAHFLDTLPEVPPEPPAPVADPREELRKRRSELARLRARRDAVGQAAPMWVHSYIADLEAEVRRLNESIQT